MSAKSDYDNHRKTTLNGRKQSPTNCDGCRKRIEGRHAPAIVAQIETNWSRGDDIVHFYHLTCWAALPDTPDDFQGRFEQPVEPYEREDTV